MVQTGLPIVRNSVTWRRCKQDKYFSLEVTRQHLYQCKISYKLRKTVTCHYVESGCKGGVVIVGPRKKKCLESKPMFVQF